MYLGSGFFRSNVDDTWLSKSLSWLLRHGAVKERLLISPDGYVTVDEILQHKTFLGKCSLSDIQRVVATNQKQRFTLRENPQSHALEIKANQGHSICNISDDELTPLLEPKYSTVVHGTYLKCWSQIKAQGLSRMKRRHIHLAKGTLEDQSVISGLRQNIELYIIIYIDLKKALTDGIKFYESKNGVILTSGDERFLQPKYFLKVVKVHSASVPMRMEVALKPAPRPAPRAAPPHASPRAASRPSPAAAADDDDVCRIHVAGYPHCTQPEDLERAFASQGGRVERMTPHDAVLRCRDPASAAVAAKGQACVYGTMLAVRLYTGQLPPQPQQPKREFSRSKQKDVIVEPRAIDLSGDFHSQLDAVLARVRLTQEEVQNLARLYTDLELALASLWPGCVCLPFGSITTGLGIKTSDADCFVDIPPRHRNPQHNYVNKAKRVLQQFPSVFAEILCIPRANTPIVKLHHLPTGTNCDVSFKSALGVRNSRLVAALLHSRPNLLPAAVLLKYWAKVHDISGSGKMSNYALTMLLLFYLQQPPRAVLPAVVTLQQDRTQDFMVHFWNTGFSSEPRLFPPPPEPYPIADLLGGFFQYYARFDFDKLAVCPYLGRPVEKDAFKDPVSLPPEFRLYKNNVTGEITYPLKYMTSLCIQDPFEQSRNVASGVGQRIAADIKAYIQFAADAYEKEKPEDCRGFLRKILLEKPKIVKGRVHPEFRINLFSKTSAELPEDEWKTRVREAVFCVFDKMLHLPLTKPEDEPVTKTSEADPKPDSKKTEATSKKEREKYLTTITRAIWRRKQFTKIYRQLTLPLVEKEKRITQEVLRVDRTELALQMNLTLTFRKAPRSVIVTARLKAGEAETFKEFGRFYLSSVQWWLTELLKPAGAGISEAPPQTTTAEAQDDPGSDDSEGNEAKSPNEVSKEGTDGKDGLDVSECLSTPFRRLATDADG